MSRRTTAGNRSLKEEMMYNLDKTEIIEQCEGCSRIHEYGKHCTVYLYPESKWRSGNCPMATHLSNGKEEKKSKVGQKKQRKRKK